MTIEYDEINDETHQIDSNSTSVLINMLQYYTWTSSDPYLSVDQFVRPFAFDEEND